MCFVAFLVQNHSKRRATFVFSVMCPTSVAQATDFCGNRVNHFLGCFCACVLSRFGANHPRRKHVRVFCDVSRLLRNQHISVEIKSIIFSNNFVNVRGFVAMHGVGKLVLCMWFQTWTGKQNLCCRSLNQNKAFRVLIVCPTSMETASQTSGTSQKTPTRRSLWDGFTNKTAKTCTTRPENDLADCNKNVETVSRTCVTSQKTPTWNPAGMVLCPKVTKHINKND